MENSATSWETGARPAPERYRNITRKIVPVTGRSTLCCPRQILAVALCVTLQLWSLLLRNINVCVWGFKMQMQKKSAVNCNLAEMTQTGEKNWFFYVCRIHHPRFLEVSFICVGNEKWINLVIWAPNAPLPRYAGEGVNKNNSKLRLSEPKDLLHLRKIWQN